MVFPQRRQSQETSDRTVSQPEVVENHSEEADEKTAGNDPFAPVQ